MNNFPVLTFLCGPDGVGKTTLANELFQIVPQLMTWSFANPIYAGVRASFYGDNPTIDLKTQSLKKGLVPGMDFTVREALIAQGQMLRSLDREIIGKMAFEFVKKNRILYPSFIFDDARLPTDIWPLTAFYGPHNCLLIDVRRPGIEWRSQMVGYPGLIAVREQERERELEYPGQGPEWWRIETISILNDNTPNAVARLLVPLISQKLETFHANS